MFGLSFWEIGLILIVALLVLGPKRLPGLAKSIGKGLRELRRASSGLRQAIEEPLEEVRRPLNEMRDDLVDAVHNIEQEIENEASKGNDPKEKNPHLENDDNDKKLEARRREVEELYASYERQDEVECSAPRPNFDQHVSTMDEAGEASDKKTSAEKDTPPTHTKNSDQNSDGAASGKILNAAKARGKDQSGDYCAPAHQTEKPPAPEKVHHQRMGKTDESSAKTSLKSSKA